MSTDHDTLVALDHRHLWHPFTQQAEWTAADPLVIVAGDGHHLVDDRGHRYLDGVGSLWVGVLGHRHPAVDAAVKDQLGRIAHSTLLGLTHPAAIGCARRLVELAPPGLTRVFFSDSGSTAVEVALKMAVQWHRQNGAPQRTVYAALGDAYHGDTLGAVSVGGIAAFHAVYGPLLTEVVRLPAPKDHEDEDLLAAEAERRIRAQGERLAAVVVEPLVQGAAGMHRHSPAWLERVVRAAHAVGALVVVDEVATGVGRTGRFFACEHLDLDDPTVRPDLLCLGKGLSNGYLPLAATLTTEAVYGGFLGDRSRTFFHGHTFTGNPLACAAANATLDVMRTERVVEGVAGRAKALAEALAGLRLRCRHVVSVRQLGLMAGVELGTPAGPLPAADLVGHRVCLAARAHGVILRPLGDVAVIMPPLTMPEADILKVVGALERAVADVLG